MFLSGQIDRLVVTEGARKPIVDFKTIWPAPATEDAPCRRSTCG